MSPTPADALARLWASSASTSMATPAGLDRTALFGRLAPLVLEIGCGMGDARFTMAAADPGRDYLAVDVHTPGLGAMLARADIAASATWPSRGDALELLRHGIEPDVLDAIHVFFPDPWPKARHHKRRIIQPEMVALMRNRLRTGGILHTATDAADYAEHMLTSWLRIRDCATHRRFCAAAGAAAGHEIRAPWYRLRPIDP